MHIFSLDPLRQSCLSISILRITFSILKLLDWPNAVNKCKQGNAGLQDLKGRDASISTTKIVPPDFQG